MIDRAVPAVAQTGPTPDGGRRRVHRLHPQARYPELARGAAYRMLCNVIDKIRVDLVKLTIEGIWPRWQHIAGGTTGLPSAPNGGKR